MTNAVLHENYFAAGQFEHISKGFTAMALVGLLGTVMSVVEYIRHNRRMKEAEV